MRKRPPKAIRDSKSRCEICGCTDRCVLKLHHIKPVSEGGQNNTGNLACVCANCHDLVHAGVYTQLQKHFTTKGWILFFEGGPKERSFPDG